MPYKGAQSLHVNIAVTFFKLLARKKTAMQLSSDNTVMMFSAIEKSQSEKIVGFSFHGMRCCASQANHRPLGFTISFADDKSR